MADLPAARRAALVAAMISAALALPSLSANAARKTTRTCKPRGSWTIARTRTLRLYWVETGPATGEYGIAKALFVCDFARRRPVRLDHFTDIESEHATHVRFNRSYVAFALAVDDLTCEKYNTDPRYACTSESVRSYGLHRGRLRASAAGGCDALAVTSGGWLAWIAPATTAGGSRTLLARDSHGRRQLDSGAIDPASLTANGATVRWTSAGVSHSARLR